MASRETPETKDLQNVSKPEGTPSPKEAPDQSKSSAEKENKRNVESSVNDPVMCGASLPFSQIRDLISKGESVCKLTIDKNVTGTGFVLFDEYVMTSAHLFKENSLKNNKLMMEVKAQFAYESPLNPPPSVDVDRTIIDIDRDLDYAVLKLTASGQKVPPGLLEHFGRIPEYGSACIIGHPEGGVKKMDFTFIIPKNERKESAAKQVKDKSLIEQVIQHNIMTSDHVITYNTFMARGTAGSPLFNEEGRVVGVHSSGILPRGQDLTVIEYARPVLEIYKRFVEKLRNQNQAELLERIREVSKTNADLFDY